MIYFAPVKRRLCAQEWDQLKIAYAAGARLRELARSACIPAGTVLARAKRDGWKQQVAEAQLIKRPPSVLNAKTHSTIDEVTPFESVVRTMRQRAERYTMDMADVSERMMPHLKRMKPQDILDNARNVEQFDRVARRTFELDTHPPARGPLSIEVLGNHTAVQIIQPPALPENSS